MKRLIIFVIFIGIQVSCAVTYTFSGGRFGDNILSYWHAKWVSYISGLPVLYQQFQYSDQLAMHYLEAHYTDEVARTFTFRYQISEFKALPQCYENNGLYIIPYFPECLQEHTDPSNTVKYPYFKVDWHNKDFIQELWRCMEPQCTVDRVDIPSDRIAVGIHIRKTSNGYDLPLLHEVETKNFSGQLHQRYSDVLFPLKFVPEQFYLESLRLIYELCGKKSLYVYIFTDDHKPEIIVERFKKYFADIENIEYAYRAVGNGHDVNVLEDFFSITRFDCFICSYSNFPIAATKLGIYKFLITPCEYRWSGAQLIITKKKIERRQNSDLLANRRHLFDGIA